MVGSGIVAGQLPPVGVLGLQLRLSPFSPRPLSLGQRSLRGRLRLASFPQSIALAKGIVTNPLNLGAGIPFGLPGPAYLRVRGDTSIPQRRQRLVPLADRAFLNGVRFSNPGIRFSPGIGDLQSTISYRLFRPCFGCASRFPGNLHGLFSSRHVLPRRSERLGQRLRLRLGLRLPRLRRHYRGLSPPSRRLSVG